MWTNAALSFARAGGLHTAPVFEWITWSLSGISGTECSFMELTLACRTGMLVEVRVGSKRERPVCMTQNDLKEHTKKLNANSS